MPNIINFENILYIGPNYRNHRGGIGAVISIYQNNIKNFNFIATYDGNFSIIGNLLVFIKSLILLFWKLLVDNNIRIVHIHGASKGSFWRKYFIFLIAKYIYRKKVVYHLHGGKFHLFYDNGNKLTKKLINHLVSGSDHVICLSRYWQTFFKNTFKINSISIVNNIVPFPIDVYSKAQMNYISILFLGRIGINKGIFDLIEVLALNKELFQNKIKMIIGGNGEINKLKKNIEENKIRDIVQFVGWVDGELKIQLLQQCDVLILPSYNEGLPISILEAMSYGKAIIASNVGGIPEVIENNINGYLISPGDKEGIAKAIINLMSNREDITRMGNNNKKKIINYYPTSIMAELSKIYCHLVK